MSAFDVAGAVVAPLLAVGIWRGENSPTARSLCAILCAAWFVFCIARLFGAHL